MTHRRGCAWGLVLGVLVGGSLDAQAVAGRWSLQLRGETLFDRGELRIDSLGARILLESRDRSWLPIEELTAAGSRIAFRVGTGRRFTGEVQGELITGRVLDGARDVAGWEARLIQPGTERWPVRPRVVVGQLITGSSDTVARFAEEWFSRILTRDALVAEHAALARDAGFAPADIRGIAARSERTMLGFDDAARDAALRLMERIAATPAADDAFRALFRTADGGWRYDLHSAAWGYAAEFQGRPLDVDAVIRGLGEVGVRADSATVRPATWRWWARQRAAPQGAAAFNAAMQRDSTTGLRLYSLLSGYDSAEHWWRRAVRWLMTARWIDTPEGWRSPVELVATFWERDSLILPDLQPHHFGMVQAVPVIGAGPIATALLRPDNAIAEEWLAAPRRRDEALDAWRGLDFGLAAPLRVQRGREEMAVVSAAGVARSRLGGFLAARHAIRIEPAILPIFAVGTVVHEWQHLLFESARLAGPSPLAFRQAPWGVTLVEADPWLGEGAAEWATEAVLAPAARMTPLLALVELEKRLAIGADIPDDTHVLGYLLVRAAVNRVATATDLRRLLERHLHDPAGFATAVGLGGGRHREIPRPSTLMVIPEVTFTLDGGVAEGVTRRLVVPDPSRES